MALIISIKDTLRQSVEAASGGRNTVLYTAKNQPCYMRVIPKFSDSTGVHPMFIVNGVEKSTRFVGLYPGVIKNGELLSLPGENPSVGNFNTIYSPVITNGPGWNLMTNADWAGLGYECLQLGFQPNGNTNFGLSSDNPSERGVRVDGLAPGLGSGTGTTRTGSGPATWRHDGTPWGVVDLCGNVWEWCSGVRGVSGEIQVIANNDAAQTTIDMSASSPLWMAIDAVSGNLTSPGVGNTVRYATSGTADYTLVQATAGPFSGTLNPGANPVSAAAITTLQRLGLFPRQTSGLSSDGAYYTNSGTTGLMRGGQHNSGAIAGVFSLFMFPQTGSGISGRPAFVS